MASLMTLSKTIIHEIDSPDLWPPEVKCIAFRLSSISTAKHPSQSLASSDSNSMTDSTQQHETETQSTALRKVENTVQSLACMQPDFVSAGSPDSPPSPVSGGRCIAVSLIASIALSCYESSDNTILLSDVPFLLPRTKELGTSGDPTVYGSATLLLCKRFGIRVAAGRVLVADTDHGGDPLGTTRGAVYTFEESQVAVEDLNQPNIPTEKPVLDSLYVLDIPFDGHVLPGRGKRSDCFVPILCVGDESNIQLLVSSCVHQRLSLGISCPVIGVMLPSGLSTTVKVVLGWVENFEAEYNRCCDWKASLPPIHLAVCESREVDPALGLYDLQSAAGPTKFAEFLLSISDQISVVQDCLRSRKSVREICWRLDHNHLDKEGQNPHISEPLSSVRSLTTWLQDVSNSRSPEVKDHSVYQKLSSLDEIISSTMLEPSADSGPELSSSPFLDSDSEGIVLPIPSPSSMSYSSAKDFAALPSSGCLDDLIYPRDDVRLWQRGAVGIARFPLKISERGKDASLAEYHRQIDDMVSLYNGILDNISWPSSWKVMDDLPCADECHHDSRQLLFEQYQHHLESGRPCSVLEQCDSSVDVLNNLLSVVFQANKLAAHGMVQQGQSSDITSTDYRLPWDLLLHAFCCTPFQPNSRVILHKQRIRLTDEMHVPKYWEQAELWADISPQQIHEVLDLHERPHANVTVRLKDRSLYATQTASQLYRRRRTEDERQDTESESDSSGHEEPRTVVVDTIFGAVQAFLSQESGLQLDSAPDEAKPFQSSKLRTPTLQAMFVDPPEIPEESIFLPNLLVKYKRDFEEENEACILDLPVFGLVADAGKGTVVMGWKSGLPCRAHEASSGNSFMMDLMVKTFDISQPFEAMQFAIAMHRVQRFGDELKGRLRNRSLSIEDD